MPFCSCCGSEYRDTVTFCPDCSEGLRSENAACDDALMCINCRSLSDPGSSYCWNCGGFLRAIDLNAVPFSFEGEVMECCHCGRSTPLGLHYCIECGYILSQAYPCTNHPDSMTRFVCLICKRPFCRNCARAINGKFVCNEDTHYHMIGNWGVVFSDNREDELAPVQELLVGSGVTAIVASQGEIPDKWKMGLFMENVQQSAEGRFQLLVPLVQIRDAEKVLIEAEYLYENECDTCGHQFNGDPIRCPNCGEEFIN